MPVPLEQFVKNLEESGILAGDTLREFIPPRAAPQDAEELARELVRQKQLTKFQVEELWRGKGKSLILGNYLLLEKIGQGGMGAVYKAEHRRMHRIVAVKMLPAGVMQEAAAVARFEREVTAAARLTHPNIVTAFDADVADGVHLLVMEFVDGTDLSALVQQRGPIAVAQALRYIVQAARGLEFAHKKGVVHRDIKPANLLLDSEGTIKILDMGLARIESIGDAAPLAELTNTGAVMGTVDYMSPEQALDTRTADARSDIYSLGCTLFYLLTGQAMYPGNTLMKKLLAHREQPIPSIRALRPEVPEQVEAIFRRMVAKPVAERYQSLSDVIADLERCDHGLEPTLVIASPADAATGSQLTNILKEIAESSAPTIPSKNRATGDGPWNTMRLLLAGGSVLGSLILVAGLVISRNAKTQQTERNSTRDNTVPRNDRAAGAGAGSENRSAGVPPPPALAPFDAEQARNHQAAWAGYLGVPVEYNNSIGMKFILIPPGEFLIGSTPAEIDEALRSVEDEFIRVCIRSESPQHKVILTQPFYLGVYEVTQAQYQEIMGTNPSSHAATGPLGSIVAGVDTSNFPVEHESWNDATEFCSKLGQRENLSPFYVRTGETITMVNGTGYRLPTEAEWEFACRAGTTTKYWTGNQEEGLKAAEWVILNSVYRPHSVGELRANPFGLYDVHGNVWEWVQDGWSSTYYTLFQEMPGMNPSNPFSENVNRVFRGGGYGDLAAVCRAASRQSGYSTTTDYLTVIGFRVALMVDAVRQARK